MGVARILKRQSLKLRGLPNKLSSNYGPMARHKRLEKRRRRRRRQIRRLTRQMKEK